MSKGTWTIYHCDVCNKEARVQYMSLPDRPIDWYNITRRTRKPTWVNSWLCSPACLTRWSSSQVKY